MNQQSADEDLLRSVRGGRQSLALLASKAEHMLDAMKKDFEAQLKEQERIVEATKKMSNDYNRQSLRWETGGNRSLPLGSTYQVETKMVKYRRNMATQVKMPYPWLATPPPPPPPAQESESEKEDLFGDPPPPPAARPKRKARMVVNDDSSKDDVVEMGQSTWHDRDAALRKKAIALDACVVDEVFRKLRVTRWTH